MRAEDVYAEIRGLTDPAAPIAIQLWCGRCGRGLATHTYDGQVSLAQIDADVAADRAAVEAHTCGG